MGQLVFEKIEAEKSGDRYRVFLDGKELGISRSKQNAEVRMGLNNYEGIKNLNFYSIPENIEILYFNEESVPNSYELFPFTIETLNLSREWGHDLPFIFISLIIDFPNWDLAISPNEFTSSFAKNIKELNEFSFAKEENPNIEGIPYIIYLTKGIDAEKTIVENLEYTIGLIQSITKNLLLNTKKNHSELSIETFFSFPEEYKSACEQYLLYFAQFLKDLGIEARTDLENQENGVLFKVFPKDKEAALAQIKEALDVYLALPLQQNIEVAATQFPDASVQQLVANVYHLKSQLMFANATIVRLQEEIKTPELFQYKNQPILHLNETNKEQKNEEKIFGGIVTVKEYEGKGINIDLPKLFRILKRIWKK